MCSEIAQVKFQNQELRAKVIRQDAAWKRKIEGERRRGGLAEQAASRTALGEVQKNSQDAASQRLMQSITEGCPAAVLEKASTAWA